MTVREHPEATPSVNSLIKYLREKEGAPEADRWLSLVRSCFRAGRTEIRGGMSGWFKVHDQAKVEALQATFDTNGVLVDLQLLGERTAAWNPMGVRFFVNMDEWSNRRFRGVMLVALSEDTFVGYDRDFLQVLAYHSVGEARKV